MSRQSSVAVLGATGLSGREIVKHLLCEKAVSCIKTITRSPLPEELSSSDSRVTQHVFNSLTEEILSSDDMLNILSSVSTIIVAFGTSSPHSAFTDVYFSDFVLPLTFARTARAAGVDTCIYVSSIGSNASNSPYLDGPGSELSAFLRVKGEAALAMLNFGFPCFAIARPPPLKDNPRIGSLLLHAIQLAPSSSMHVSMHPIPTRVLGRALAHATSLAIRGRPLPSSGVLPGRDSAPMALAEGVFVLEVPEILQLAEAGDSADRLIAAAAAAEANTCDDISAEVFAAAAAAAAAAVEASSAGSFDGCEGCSDLLMQDDVSPPLSAPMAAPASAPLSSTPLSAAVAVPTDPAAQPGSEGGEPVQAQAQEGAL